MEIMSPKKKKTTTSTSSYVPNDIIIDILSWVPAKSLLRLRWACKHWFHLNTRDTSFAKLHLHTATSTNQDYFSVLISKPLINPSYYQSTWKEPCKIFQCYINYYPTTATSSGSFSCGAMNPILSGIFVEFRILGSCHGLILFSYYLRERKETILCIWNPCTKEYKYLPKPPCYGNTMYADSFANKIFGVNSTNFGFGYDNSIQDYKVICNVKSRDGRSIHVQIYALRTNSCRYFKSSSCIWFFGNGVFVNGALYFLENSPFIYSEPDYPRGRRILSLDFEKETYGEISNRPECLNDKAKFIKGGLTMFEGSLCLTMHTGFTISTTSEAWVMKKDMNNNQEEYSWSKLYEIPHFDGIINHLLPLLPLRFTKDGEILLLGRKEGFVLFDPKNNKITIHKLHPIDQAASSNHINQVIYTESLVSLNSGSYINLKESTCIIGRSNYD